jgi:hypothetical protein
MLPGAINYHSGQQSGSFIDAEEAASLGRLFSVIA